MYQKVNVNISEGQKDKIQKAMNKKETVTIRIDPTEAGNDILALTQTQINQLNKGKAKNITLSKAQLKYNLKVEGGFLAALAALAARVLPMLASKVLPTLTKTILPSLATGAVSGLASTGIKKILGDGIYLKKGGCVCEVETDGKGVYLGNVNGGDFKKYGDGLYLKREGNIYDGSGLILGENSPFKNIPILGLLL